jgi:hypothetical protein
MLHFRLRFDRSILKTIDEEEYVSAYSSRSPARRNVTMVRAAGPAGAAVAPDASAACLAPTRAWGDSPRQQLRGGSGGRKVCRFCFRTEGQQGRD